MKTTSPLTAREVCQVLKDVALGKRIMMRSTIQSWNEIYHGLIPVQIDGWQRDGADPIERLVAAL